MFIKNIQGMCPASGRFV